MRKILFIICWALAGVGLYSCSLDEPSYVDSAVTFPIVP